MAISGRHIFYAIKNLLRMRTICCGAIAKLSILVITPCPKSSIIFEYHKVASTRSYIFVTTD